MEKTIYDIGESSSLQTEMQLRSLLAPLEKSQLLHLLATIGAKIPQAAEEIISAAGTQPFHRKLFVRGFGSAATSETLREAFSSYGEIEEAAIPVNRATGRSRCFGFVTFKNMESARRALESPSIQIDGHAAGCSLAGEGSGGASRAASIALRKLYVGGLSEDTTTAMLVSFFEEYGELEEGAVVYDRETQKSRKFGFVTYSKAMDARKAIADPDKTIAGRRIIVRHAFPQRESVTRAS